MAVFRLPAEPPGVRTVGKIAEVEERRGIGPAVRYTTGEGILCDVLVSISPKDD